MTCANCPKPVVGGPKYSRESVLCQACADKVIALHIQAQKDRQPKDDLLK